MRWQIIFLIAISLLILSLSIFIGEKIITGEIIHGKAVKGVGMNITIIAPPSLTLISPRNETYLNNITIPLEYSSDSVSVKYSLDSGDNITLTSSPVYFNASEGDHTLYLYSNNSNGITIKSVNFSINSVLFKVNNDKWKGSNNEKNSTNLSIVSSQEIQNISNLTFEDTNNGKIRFNGRINITNDINPEDGEVDLDEYINISSNRIEVNTSAIPEFDKPATLWLYGLTFTNPRILIDGESCPSAICKKENYSGGVLKFNVTGFSVYSSDETPITTTTTTTVTVTGGGTSGGGYGARLPEGGFILNAEDIQVSVKQGQIVTKNFIITNQDNKNINIKINELKIEDLVLIQEQNFSLGPYQSKIISFDIFAREDTLPKLYLGKIFISSESTRKELLVGIEVESKEPLFDVKVSIPDRFLYTMPGEEFFSELEIYNLGDIEKEVDVLIEYKIMDFNGKEIYSNQETVAVNTKINFLKSFKIPEDAPFGRYVLYIKTIYDEKVGSASIFFNVGKKPTIPLKEGIIAIIIVLIISGITIFYRIRKLKKLGKSIYRIDKNSLKR
ncbi:MAG: hypothetical protein Q7S06_00205 [Nanoarchaeota archaeon]|nr:hypothetical protein [Nanoarchaeota archaeon]